MYPFFVSRQTMILDLGSFFWVLLNQFKFMELAAIFENRTYSVKQGCNIKLEDTSQNNPIYIILEEMEKFQVESYSSYDVYGEDYFIYNCDRFLLRWDKIVYRVFNRIGRIHIWMNLDT